MYLQLDEGFEDHPKSVVLCRLIKNPEGCMFIARVWRWALRSSRTGDLSKVEPRDIERIARWRGRAGVLYKAMVVAGFIEDNEQGARALHDWLDWSGANLASMEADSRRKRIDRLHRTGRCPRLDALAPCPICLREKSNGIKTPTSETPSAGHPLDVRRMSTVRQDKTGQDRTDPDPECGVAASRPTPPTSPTLLVFPTVRGARSGPTEWHYTEALESELRGYFPALDVRTAVAAALGWINAKPERRKTAGGMMAFLTSWLTRAQNRGENLITRRPGQVRSNGVKGPSSKELEAERKRVADSWGKAPVTIDEVWDDGKAWWEKKAKP